MNVADDHADRAQRQPERHRPVAEHRAHQRRCRPGQEAVGEGERFAVTEHGHPQRQLAVSPDAIGHVPDVGVVVHRVERQQHAVGEVLREGDHPRRHDQGENERLAAASVRAGCTLALLSPWFTFIPPGDSRRSMARRDPSHAAQPARAASRPTWVALVQATGSLAGTALVLAIAPRRADRSGGPAPCVSGCDGGGHRAGTTVGARPGAGRPRRRGRRRHGVAGAAASGPGQRGRAGRDVRDRCRPGNRDDRRDGPRRALDGGQAHSARRARSACRIRRKDRACSWPL